jgi:hypothetical protein
MFIADPGSGDKKISDPESWSAAKSLSIFNPKKLFLSSRKYDPGCASRTRIPDPDLDFISRAQKGTGSQIRIRNTAKR